MKALFRIAICFLCLVPACGGRTGADDLFDDSTTTTVGGSSTETSTTQAVTGGASNVSTATTIVAMTGGASSGNATGGSSALPTTGGASTASTATTTAVTGGASSLATLTGGATSVTPTTTGGTTNIATSAQETGGATSVSTISATGGSSAAISTGGSSAASTGGTATTTIDTPFDVTLPQTDCLRETNFRLPEDGENNNNLWIGPFCCTGKTVTIHDREGDTIGYVYFYDFDQGYIIGKESFASSLSIRISSAPHYGSDETQLQSAIQFTIDDMKKGVVKTATIGVLTYTIKVTHADIITPFNNTPLFNMQTLKVGASVSLLDDTACSPLVVSLSKDTPKSQIIVSGTSWGSWYTFSDYVVKNMSTVPQTIASITVSGSIANFITVNVSVCANNYPAGAGLSNYAPDSYITLEDGSTDPWHPNTLAHFVDDASLLFDLTWGTARTTLNPNEELHLCVIGTPSAVRTEMQDAETPGRDPRSGDQVALKISDLIDTNGVHAYFDGSNEPPKMILHKSAPVITFQPITDYLKIGKSKIASVIVSNTSEYPLALQQVEFNISTNGVRYKQIRDEQGNPASIYINGVISPSSILFSDTGPTFGVVKFTDGDHLITKSTPMTIDIYVDIEQSPSAMWITTKLLNTWPLDSYTGFINLVGLGSPGQIIGWKTSEQQNVAESTMYWSDLSSDANHIPFTGGITSDDFLTGALVTGTDGSSIVIYP